jgi:hypothetical protein
MVVCYIRGRAKLERINTLYMHCLQHQNLGRVVRSGQHQNFLFLILSREHPPKFLVYWFPGALPTVQQITG